MNLENIKTNKMILLHHCDIINGGALRSDAGQAIGGVRACVGGGFRERATRAALW